MTKRRLSFFRGDRGDTASTKGNLYRTTAKSMEEIVNSDVWIVKCCTGCSIQGCSLVIEEVMRIIFFFETYFINAIVIKFLFQFFFSIIRMITQSFI